MPVSWKDALDCSDDDDAAASQLFDHARGAAHQRHSPDTAAGPREAPASLLPPHQEKATTSRKRKYRARKAGDAGDADDIKRAFARKGRQLAASRAREAGASKRYKDATGSQARCLADAVDALQVQTRGRRLKLTQSCNNTRKGLHLRNKRDQRLDSRAKLARRQAAKGKLGIKPHSPPGGNDTRALPIRMSRELSFHASKAARDVGLAMGVDDKSVKRHRDVGANCILDDEYTAVKDYIAELHSANDSVDTFVEIVLHVNK